MLKISFLLCRCTMTPKVISMPCFSRQRRGSSGCCPRPGICGMESTCPRTSCARISAMGIASSMIRRDFQLVTCISTIRRQGQLRNALPILNASYQEPVAAHRKVILWYEDAVQTYVRCTWPLAFRTSYLTIVAAAFEVRHDAQVGFYGFRCIREF